MDTNDIDNVKNLLEREIDTIEDGLKKDRMKYLLNQYSRPKFRINTLLYVFFLPLIICLFWQNRVQQAYIQDQHEEINSLIFYMIYTSPDILENDSVANENTLPYEFGSSFEEEPIVDKSI